jgi:hypothetical protein
VWSEGRLRRSVYVITLNTQPNQKREKRTAGAAQERERRRKVKGGGMNALRDVCITVYIRDGFYPTS